jgi:hypothetical protein
MEAVQMDVHKDARDESVNHCSTQGYERQTLGGTICRVNGVED